MEKKPLVKLGFAVLIAVAALMGLSAAPARAVDCPPNFGSCVLVGQNYSCCYYADLVRPELTCPNYCP